MLVAKAIFDHGKGQDGNKKPENRQQFDTRIFKCVDATLDLSLIIDDRAPFTPTTLFFKQIDTR